METAKLPAQKKKVIFSRASTDIMGGETQVKKA